MERERLHRFEREVLDFIAERLDAMGERDSGLFAYYAQRVNKKRALTRYEHELLDYLDGDGWIVHAGIGIGVLTAGLALQGSRVLGFEFDERRFAAAMALKERLAPSADYRLRPERFPAGLRPEDDTASATLLFTNVASSWPDELYSSVIEAMHRFRRVILDLRLFGHTRNEESERDALAARLEKSGLALRSLPFRAGNSFYVEIHSRQGQAIADR